MKKEEVECNVVLFVIQTIKNWFSNIGWKEKKINIPPEVVMTPDPTLPWGSAHPDGTGSAASTSDIHLHSRAAVFNSGLNLHPSPDSAAFYRGCILLGYTLY